MPIIKPEIDWLNSVPMNGASILFGQASDVTHNATASATIEGIENPVSVQVNEFGYFIFPTIYHTAPVWVDVTVTNNPGLPNEVSSDPKRYTLV